MRNLLGETAGLVAFVRTVETGSFSAAARSLRTTPSGVSKSISRLESLLGLKLFRRSTRILTLTPDGETFFGSIAPLLRQIEESSDVFQADRGATGHLHVSLPSELARLLMVPIFTRFLPQHPGITLDLGTTDRHVDLIRENYDIAFRVGKVTGSDLMMRTLMHLDMALVASPAFVDTWGPVGTVERLRELPFARYAIDGHTYPIHFADGATMIPTGQVDLDTATAIRIAALSGVGVAYLMKCIVQEELDRGELIQILPDLELETMPFQTVHAFGRMPTYRLRLFSDFIETEMQKRASR